MRSSYFLASRIFGRALRRPVLVNFSPAGMHATLSFFPNMLPHTQYRGFIGGYQQMKYDPYELLGVDRSASKQEIKMAYFREAKKHHPDLNPNDPRAKERFQKLTEAYEILSKPESKAQYDSYGTYAGQQTSGPSAEESSEIFNNLWQDIDIIKEACAEYGEELREEVGHAIERARHNDWKPLQDIAKANAGLIIGVVLPLGLLLRFPAAVGFAVRLLWGAIPFVVLPLLRSGQGPVVARWIWRKVVQLAKASRNRRRRS